MIKVRKVFVSLAAIGVASTAWSVSVPASASDGAQYVALGDSYTALPGIGASAASPASFCGESAENYPRLLAQRLGLSLKDASCGNATTANVTTAQTMIGSTDSAPPQIGAVTSDARLVTIGLGANDNSLFVSLAACGVVSGLAPAGNPCQTLSNLNPFSPAKKVGQVVGKLRAIVRLVRDRAPHARIVLVGYPQLLPSSGGCPSVWPLAAGDVQFVNATMDALDDAVKTAALQTGSTFLDLRPVTAGHNACSADPWFNGYQASDGNGIAYHPRSPYPSAVAAQLAAAIK